LSWHSFQGLSADLQQQAECRWSSECSYNIQLSTAGFLKSLVTQPIKKLIPYFYRTWKFIYLHSQPVYTFTYSFSNIHFETKAEPCLRMYTSRFCLVTEEWWWKPLHIAV
jgi:hypothetical protein